MADQWPDINNENLSSATKKMWIPNVVSQVVFKMPMLAKMYLSGQVKKAWDGGTVITRPVKVARMENLAQSFDENDQLTGGRVSMLKTPAFQWKDNQVPLVYTRREATMNSGSSRVLDFAAFLTEAGFEASRINLYKDLYNNTAAGSTGASTDSGKKFQSICQALDHGYTGASTSIGYTYGNLTRDRLAGTLDEWQSADIDDSFAGSSTDSAQDTEITASIANFRKAVAAVRRNAEPNDKFLCVVGPTLHQAFQSYVQAGIMNTKIASQPGSLAHYGFNSFTIDGIEVVEDPYLRNANVTNAHKWFFIFDISTWELRFKPGEMFRLTDFQDQAVIINGYPQSMARIYNTGNFMCWAPNRNIWLTNMVA